MRGMKWANPDCIHSAENTYESYNFYELKEHVNGIKDTCPV